MNFRKKKQSRDWLIGGAITILKNMKVNGKDYPPKNMEQ
jgi:hypothetical protein